MNYKFFLNFYEFFVSPCPCPCPCPCRVKCLCFLAFNQLWEVSDFLKFRGINVITKEFKEG